MRENAKHITRVSSEEARRLKGKTDHARLDAMTDEDIAAASAADPDAPPLDVDWTQAPLVLPPGKDIVTLRLDRDVLDWFRAQGRGYQTRINQVLRAFYEARGRDVEEPPSPAMEEADRPAAPSSREVGQDVARAIGDGLLRSFQRRKRKPG